MAPPIPAHLQRFTANPARPARYRPGKALQEEEPSDEEEEEEEQPQQQKPLRKAPPRPIPSRAPQPTADDEDDDDEEGFVTEDEDADGGAPVAVSQAKPSTDSAPRSDIATRGIVEAQPTQPYDHAQISNEEDESDESDDESEEESSSSEDEAPRRKFQRPTFIKKDARAQQPIQSELNLPATTPEISSSSHTDETAARRLAEAESLIKSTIERDTAARLAGRKAWDDDDELPPEALVDDTDNLDPAAEHLAWRLRELHRLKRDRQAMIAREKELEEIERRRNLTKEERDAEDREFIAKQKEEHDQTRGQANYMSKYHHKGAFFMDDEVSERLAKRDLIGARFQDDIADKSVLPEYMRVRDMTKLGKKGRTRYTDLKGQDTGRFGDEVKRWRGSGYEQHGSGYNDRGDVRSMDERFLPDDERAGGGPRASGANASTVGERRKRDRGHSRSRSPRRGRGEESYRARSRSPSNNTRRRRRSYSPRRSGSSSRSKSPPRHARRRSPSPYHERDKRRRVNV